MTYYAAGTGRYQLIVDVVGYIRATAVNLLTWSPPQSIDPEQGDLKAVSCASPRFCVAGDESGGVLMYDGTAWRRSVAVRTDATVTAVSCPSVSFCLAAAHYETATSVVNALVTYQGSRWTTVGTVPGEISLSCVSVAFCLIVDAQGGAYRYDGSGIGATTAIGQGLALTAVSCASSAYCIGVAYSGAAAEFDGATWHLLPASGADELEAVSCGSITFCVALGQENSDAYVFNSSDWATVSLSVPEGLHAISCPSALSCLALDYAGVGVRWNGSTWHTGILDPTQLAQAVSCTSSTFCVVTDNDGGEVSYDGTSYVRSNIDKVQGYLNAVSCPTTTFCLAIDGEGNSLTFDGTTWTAPVSVVHDDLKAVSCPSSEFCAAVTIRGFGLVWTGTTWTSTSLTSAPLTSVSCASPRFCAAVDNDGYAFLWDGSEWSSGALIDSGRRLTSVSCPGPAFCLAVDGPKSNSGPGANSVVYNGTDWASPVPFAGGNAAMTSVSCVSNTSCAAVGYDQAMIVSATYDGSTFGNLEPDPLRFSQISCVPGLRCVGAGLGSAAGYFDGYTWSPPGLVALNPGDGIVGISCPESIDCVAITEYGSAVSGR